jgi:1-hydroxy-2-isopentenylcarotenoid 3,4-desaturase
MPIIKPGDQSYPESYWTERQASCSALLLYLGIRGALPELEHHNLFFVDAWRENFDALYGSGGIPDQASMYISRTSATDPDVAPLGHETLFALIPLPAKTELDAEQSRELTNHHITQIEHITGVSLIDRIVHKSVFTPNEFGTAFNSWQNSMLGPSHVLKQSAFWRTPNRSKKLPNLYYVGGGTTPGVGLPMCLISAQNVADRILKEQR